MRYKSNTIYPPSADTCSRSCRRWADRSCWTCTARKINFGGEELIAELGAALLSAEFGFDGELRHAGYVGNWIELSKADKRTFFTACSQGSKAANYLLGMALTASNAMAA